MRYLCAVVFGLVTGVMTPWSVNASNGSCADNVNIAVAQLQCELDGDEGLATVAAISSEARYRYEYIARCKPGEGCIRSERLCRTLDGSVGAWYLVRRVTIATGEVQAMGVVCVSPGEEEDVTTITPAMVRREMQRLDWPTAQLEVQPPDGQTLINFETNFFTENTAPTTQTVTLLGQRVEIEATPSEYTWDFGDGTSTTTTSPGAAYPGLDVTHEYAEPGRVAPSVDTTYTGRFRINGDAWQPIPGSLTVPGEAVALRVRSASPHLVGNY